jgi:hypothetical protein
MSEPASLGWARETDASKEAVARVATILTILTILPPLPPRGEGRGFLLRRSPIPEPSVQPGGCFIECAKDLLHYHPVLNYSMNLLARGDVSRAHDIPDTFR